MTPAQTAARVGISVSLALVAAGLIATLTTPTRVGFDSCVQFRPDWGDDGGVKVVRIGGVKYSHGALLQLGYPAGSPAYAYCASELQYYPAVQGDGVTPDWSQLQPLPAGVDLPEDLSEYQPRASAVAPACQLAVRCQGSASPLFACACSSGANCTSNTYDTRGNVTTSGAAPVGTTLKAEWNWTGSGCVPKACTEQSGSSSWPAACPGGS